MNITFSSSVSDPDIRPLRREVIILASQGGRGTYILALICSIAFSDRHAASFLGSFELKKTTAIEKQVRVPTAKAVPAKDRSKFQTKPVSEGEARSATLLQEVGGAEQGVVHIGEDVTVRYFTPKPAPHRVPVGRYQVARIGEDVTVRYFTPIDHTTRDHGQIDSTKKASPTE
jgi:hypothetical protein